VKNSDIDEHGLKKTLGYWDSLAINVAIIIGVGIFRIPSEVARCLNLPTLILSAWFIGALIALFGTLCYAELSYLLPKTGGSYIYLRESYGPLAGFLFSWTELSVVRTGSVAAVSFIFAEYLLSFLSLPALLVKPTAIFVVILLSSLNIVGLQYSKRLQDTVTSAKVLALIAIIVFGFMSQKGSFSNFNYKPFSINSHTLSLLGTSLIPILWTYGGWHESTFVAGETKDARIILPRALISGIFIISVLYIAMNALYIYLMPIQKIAGSNLIGAETLEILCGRYGRKVLELFVIISSFGCINAMTITGSRVTYAMARDNKVFAHLSLIHPKYNTPYWAIIANAFWSVILIMLGAFDKLLFFTGVVVWLFFGLTAAGIFILRRKFPKTVPSYRIFIPVVFTFVCFSLVVNIVKCYPFQSAMGLGLVGIGIPIYIVSKIRERMCHENIN
jgi:amino acid transporter